MITAEQLGFIMPQCPQATREAFVPHLIDAMNRYDITSKPRITAFLAQAAHESGQLLRLVENLNYSAEGLMKTWPKRFTAQLAAECARKPEKIANVVYASRLGNGPEGSGDGWRFRGRGIFQLTGRTNYGHCSMSICGSPSVLLATPELLEQPELACRSAGWFWQVRDLNRLADEGRFREITLAINGGTHGFEERTAYFYRAQEALS